METFSVLLARWIPLNNRDTGALKRHRALYGAIIMESRLLIGSLSI